MTPAERIRAATESVQRFNAAAEQLSRFIELDKRANHFATPAWQRPYWRLRAEIVRGRR